MEASLSNQEANTIVVLGASRGLGAALLAQAPAPNIYGVARRPGALAQAKWLTADLTKEADVERMFADLARVQPDVVICCVGGGPYGAFQRQKWSAHLWAWQLSLLFPAQLLHWVLNQSTISVRQLVFVGSSIAENRADPLAASYSSAKHGLHGLFRTVRAEKPQLDLRLYSPGYMDTAMIPRGASVRQQRLWAVDDVAKDLWRWLKEGPAFDHRCLADTP